MRSHPMIHRALAVGGLLAALAAAAPARPVAAGRPAGGPAAAPHQGLPWIADDLTRAVAEAKARRVPIFVESWAPW
jgi:hypothetical protein